MIAQLSLREKRLALAVALIFFLGGNFLLLDAYRSQRSRLQGEVQTKAKQLRLMHGLIDDEAFWVQRDQWLQAAQPPLDSGDAAGVQMLDRVKEVAKKSTVLLEKPTIRPPDNQPGYTAVAVEVETKSAWLPLVDFLYDIQGPEQFVALENAHLQIDPADPALIRGRFKIARWYAPQK